MTLMAEFDENQKTPNGKSIDNRRLFQRKRIIIPVFLIIIAIAAGVRYWYVNVRGYVSTDDAYVDGDKVTTSSKILGRIVDLTVDEGDSVKRGQLLVRLDDSDLKAQEAQAEANLKYALQNVSLSRVSLERAQDDFNRAARQFKDNVIPQEQYDHAQKALDMARAQLDLAQAQVNTAQAQLNVVQTQLKNTQINAPFAGLVAKRWVIAGDVVQPGQPIFTINDLQNVWVSAILEETKLDAVHLGDPVKISVDAYPGHEFDGKVILIGASAASQFSLIPPNNASGNFTKVTQRVPIKIAISKMEPLSGGDAPTLLPGMSVEVKVRVERK
jgi:membrane fusion protein (multidrug efflux system)